MEILRSCFHRLSFMSMYMIRGQRGGTTLSLFFSTIGGALFLFSFYNLAEYTAARSGAEQAARRAARCLSPSDPECKSVVPDGITGTPNANWFGYQPSFGPTSVTVDTYRYTGEVTQEIYSAEYNSYEVQTAQHQIIWDEQEVKPQRFVGLLNSYANLMADVTIYVQPIAGGPEKECRLNNVVNLPAGIDFNSSTYFDTRWCAGFLQGGGLLPGASIATASGCTDVTNGSWALSPGADRANSYCSLTIPKPRSVGDLPWLLLGGDPICDNSANSPSENIAQSVPELNQQFKDKGFKDPEPGDSQIRPFPITPSRQFLVVETFSCDPADFLSKLDTQVKTNASLKQFFKGSDSVALPRFDSLPFPLKEDFLTNLADGTDANSFIYQGLSGVSFIGEEDWTYLEWSRQADGLRKLTREVCQWLPWEDAMRKWPELGAQYDPVSGLRYRDIVSGKKFYQSGNVYAPEIQATKFAKAPSCLSPTDSVVQPFVCANREIMGQAGAYPECSGWNTKRAQLETEYRENSNHALSLNGINEWRDFQDLPTDFSYEVIPRYDSGVTSPLWEFSWSGAQFRGKSIIVPTSIRAKGGQNPKILSSNLQVPQLKFISGDISQDTRSNLLEHIKLNEGNYTTEGWGTLLGTANFTKVQESALALSGAWPFISDDAGAPVAQVRPYIGGANGNSPHDYNLDCTPEDDCEGAPLFTTIDEALRFYGNNAPEVQGKGNLSDVNVQATFLEENAGNVTMTIDQARALPQCTAFSTTCGKGSVGNPIGLGASNGPPASCLNGTFVNCYPQYGAGDVGQQSYRVDTNFRMARDRALQEVRTLLPQAIECPQADTANCVAIDISEANGEVRVNVNFMAPLTYPFNSMLASDTLLISGSTTELLETERLKAN